MDTYRYINKLMHSTINTLDEWMFLYLKEWEGNNK